MQQQQYADNTQLYIALTPSDPSPELAAIKSCLASLQLWFYTNGMASNPDKSHTILFGSAQRTQLFSGPCPTDVAGSITLINSHIKLHGVTLNSHLSVSEHTKLVSQSCFYYIRALHHIHDTLDLPNATAIAAALITR